MKRMQTVLTKLGRDRKGATVVEYGLILALVVLSIMTSLIAVGTVTGDMWNNVSTKVRAASSG